MEKRGREAAAWLRVMKENKSTVIGVEWGVCRMCEQSQYVPIDFTLYSHYTHHCKLSADFFIYFSHRRHTYIDTHRQVCILTSF